ncbi:MAG: hypothetical protein K2W33_08035 [Burkholderiales bacterium]|nr:hypothetical protein [Burkholderiales bacterium]
MSLVGNRPTAAGHFSGVPAQRAKMRPMQAQRAAMAGAVVRIGNADRVRHGAAS